MELLIVCPLLLLIIQDLRYRYVYLWSLALFGIIQFVACYYIYGLFILSYNILFNMILLCFIGLILCFYLLFRFKGRLKGIGSGDLLFIPLLTPYFDVRSFLVFLIISFSFTLVGWLIYCCCFKKSEELNKIPLVSGVGSGYLLVLFFNFTASL